MINVMHVNQTMIIFGKEIKEKEKFEYGAELFWHHCSINPLLITIGVNSLSLIEHIAFGQMESIFDINPIMIQ